VDAGNDRVGILNDATMGSNFNVLTQMSLGADNNNRAILDFSSANFSIGTIQSGTTTFSTLNVNGGKVGIGASSLDSDSLLHLKSTQPNIFFEDTDDSKSYRLGASTVVNLVDITDSNKELVRFGNTAAVFNEASNDIDFRVESDASANMLFVDAANNRVFINSAATAITKFQSAQFAIGANSAFRVLNTSGTGANDTGISVNAGGNGMAMLVIGTRNTGAGTNTASGMYLLNFAYDGDNTPTSTHIAGTNFLSFGKSSGNDLTITNAGSGNCAVFLMMIG
jgi:hypothetical protein